jgi:hypothetical protein
MARRRVRARSLRRSSDTSRRSPASQQRTLRSDWRPTRPKLIGSLASVAFTGVALVGAYVADHGFGAAVAASIVATATAASGIVLTHMRGGHRDNTYRSAVTALTRGGKVDSETLTAMAMYEAVASGQLDSADIADLLGRAIKSVSPVGLA